MRTAGQPVKQAKVVLCVEEHRQRGGLSTAVLHTLMADEPITPRRFASVGVDDGFPEGYGSYQDMMAHYGITAEALSQRARGMLSSIGP